MMFGLSADAQFVMNVHSIKMQKRMICFPELNGRFGEATSIVARLPESRIHGSDNRATKSKFPVRAGFYHVPRL